MSNIFRSYDARGLYPEEINEEVVFKIAQAVVRHFQAKKLVVGEDIRESSPALAKKVIEAVLSSGCDVLFIGQASSAVFYYAVNELKADGGIMITASHNGPEYNGLKISDAKGETVGLESGLEEIEKIYEKMAEPQNGRTRGQLIHREDILEDYISEIIKLADAKEGDFNFKIIADAGDGAAALTTRNLFEKLKIDYIPVFFEIDGKFSNRPANPYLEGALKPLSRAVLLEKADLGIAFDVDGDRVAFVDEKGNTIPASYILYFLWKEMSGRLAKPKVVHGVNYPKVITKLFDGKGIPSKQGRINFTKIMRESGAKLGGENSGHIFFPEMNFSECPELVVLKIMQIMKEESKTLSELVGEIKNNYVNSGEINLAIGDPPSQSFGGASKPQAINLIQKVKEKYKDGTTTELDGISVEYPDWWFNLRAANTEPMLRLFVEAKSKVLLEEKIKEITEIIKAAE